MVRERALKILLVLIGLLFVAGVYPLITSLSHRNPSDYPDQMMLAIYVTLGVFLLLAIRDPSRNHSLIAFTAWSSLAHAAVMTVQSIQIGSERTDLLPLAVAGVIAVAVILLAGPKQTASPTQAPGSA